MGYPHDYGTLHIFHIMQTLWQTYKKTMEHQRFGVPVAYRNSMKLHFWKVTIDFGDLQSPRLPLPIHCTDADGRGGASGKSTGESLGCVEMIHDSCVSSSGWWLGHPSEKYESQLGWWHSQYEWENIRNGNQTTNPVMISDWESMSHDWEIWRYSPKDIQWSWLKHQTVNSYIKTVMNNVQLSCWYTNITMENHHFWWVNQLNNIQ